MLQRCIYESELMSMNLEDRQQGVKVAYFELYQKLLAKNKKLIQEIKHKESDYTKLKNHYEDIIVDKDAIFKKLLEDYENLVKNDNTRLLKASTRII